MHLKRIAFYFLFLLIIITVIISGCGNKIMNDLKVSAENEQKIKVAVSIVPQETFVNAVGGELVDVVTMIPPGNSPANYQPTPEQMTKFSDADVYFSIGVPTEKANILPKINDFNKSIKLVPLADNVDEIYPHRYFDETQGQKDPHIWLSPKRVEIMVKAIGEELIQLDPKNRDTYEKNTKEYIAKLEELDNEIKNILSECDEKSFIIYHPAFGYFADDYGLNMIEIEKSGKDATSQELQRVIDISKQKNIKVIFYQEEFDDQQAETIAREIQGVTVKVAPLAPNYIENLRYIANEFKKVLK